MRGNEPGYCTKCGAIRIRVVEQLDKFSYETGERLTRGWLVCPMWRRWWGITNGHDHWLSNPWYDG